MPNCCLKLLQRGHRPIISFDGWATAPVFFAFSLYELIALHKDHTIQVVYPIVGNRGMTSTAHPKNQDKVTDFLQM